MKPISFGLGKPKGAAPAQSAGTTSRKTHTPSSSRLSRTALRHDSDNEDEEEPRHESVSGFSSSGAILSQPLQDSQEKVIPNAGNADWRRQGRKNLLPAEVQAQQQNGNGVVVVERDEVSKASGLQFAEKDEEEREHQTNGSQQSQEEQPATQPKQLTADEEALQALLDDGSGKPRSNAVITIQGNRQLSPQDETQDFREDVASRPDSSTLEEYAAMPVEEFGMAMLRGMGQKRRANGEIIDLAPKNDDNPRKLRKQEGFLGIGAKAAPGSDIELGAWGKADMRKNTKGQGFFTPLMRENKATGERISEDEFQKRLKESSNAKQEEEWKQRRDRNLEISGRDRHRDKDSQKNGDRDYREQMNSFSRSSSSRGDRDGREDSRSRRDTDDRDYERSRSRLRPIEVIGTGTGTETEIEIETGTEKKTETVTEIGTEIETETATVATGTDNVGLVGKENREVFGQMESLHA
ncbi:Pre-mRNA-splicing factor spp2 [Fonsecaea pedrosoi]|nr:Pre-mRNA-splicing factor spp2 [Fonsecaea pedrosoi]